MIDLLKLSIKNIFRKGIRTILTMLGISVGVASVILVLTVGSAGVSAVNNELDSLGLYGITITAKDDLDTELNSDDLEAVRHVDNVSEAMPILTQTSSVSLNGNLNAAMVWGVDSGAKQVIAIEILYGRAISEFDVENGDNVCLVDEGIANKIYGRNNVVGKELSILVSGSYNNYTIIGVTKAGSGLLQSVIGDFIPNFVYIPYTTMQSLSGNNSISQIAVKLKDKSNFSVVSEDIIATVDARKGITDSVSIENLSNQRDKLSDILSIIKTVLSGIGAISLLVAGLGIMTVMLVSVNERTKEIGIKKAIGASFSKIMSEFLLEALTISMLGSIIGTILGISAAFIGGKLFGINVSIALNDVVLAVLSAIITGVMFGIYPAYKAAKLEPVDALRCD